MSENRMVERTQDIIAEGIEEQAAWRRQKAIDYPEDDRNEQAAEGLMVLAAYVRGLPDDDQRIIDLAHLAIHGDVFSLPMGLSPGEFWAQGELSRFRFDDPTTDCDRFLNYLVPIVRDDVLEWMQRYDDDFNFDSDDETTDAGTRRMERWIDAYIELRRPG